MNAAVQQSTPVKSGAAGAATFPGSDSRKYNYFEPKGRKATHYEDMTVDVQPDPERYLLQDWIISFPDGTPTYSKNWTKAQSSNWHQFRSIDQEWERTHYQRQSTICGMVQGVIENARKSGAPKRMDKTWVKILQDNLGAWKHAEFGLGTSMMQAQRYGYTQMINTAILTNSSYKLRFAQDITLYLAEIGLDVEGFDETPVRNIGSRIPSGRERARRSKRSWARVIFSSNISPPILFSNPWLASCSAAALSCRRRPRRATSPRRRSFQPPRPTTSATSPTLSNSFTC